MVADKEIHFGWYVRGIRKRKRLSLGDFGKAIGVGEKRAWDIEQMREPRISDETYRGIASVIGVEPEQLESTWRATPVQRPKKRKAKSAVPPAVPDSDSNILLVGPHAFRPIPTFYGLPAGGFDPRDGETGSGVLTTFPDVGDTAFAAVIRGRCMAPTFPDGATVAFEPVTDPAKYRVGECYCVSETGEGSGGATFKQLVKLDGAALTFQCLNPDEKRAPFVVKRANLSMIARAVKVVLPVGPLPVAK